MKSDRLFLIITLSLIFATSGFPQAAVKADKAKKVDLTGTWRLHKVNEYWSAFPIRPKGETASEVEMVVSQSGETLIVTKIEKSPSGVYSKDFVYYIDGRGESNKGYNEKFTYESKTKLNGRKLISEIIIHVVGSKDTNYKREEWEISSDGKKLIVKISNWLSKDDYTRNSGNLNTMLPRYDQIFKLVS